MSEVTSSPDQPHSSGGTAPAEMVTRNLALLRRHARALTGSQSSGDRYAVATLETILSDPAALTQAPLNDRGALFCVFYRIWQSSGETLSDLGDTSGARGEALRRLSKLTPQSREALLLHTVEDFTLEEVGKILSIARDEAGHLVDMARQEMYDAIQGRVMVIEDEPVIAMDIEGIVESMGHQVSGIATTATEAIALGRSQRPDLILADIHLADGSSGIDAVNTLLQEFTDVPVIFITAFPDRLLSGERPEPAFLIAKPYVPAQVMAAVSQAMFFASTETLKV